MKGELALTVALGPPYWNFSVVLQKTHWFSISLLCRTTLDWATENLSELSPVSEFWRAASPTAIKLPTSCLCYKWAVLILQAHGKPPQGWGKREAAVLGGELWDYQEQVWDRWLRSIEEIPGDKQHSRELLTSSEWVYRVPVFNVRILSKSEYWNLPH